MSIVNKVLVGFLVLGFLSSCGDKLENKEEENLIQHTVNRLKSGALIQQFNENQSNLKNLEPSSGVDVRAVPRFAGLIEEEQDQDIEIKNVTVISNQIFFCNQIPAITEDQVISEEEKQVILFIIGRCLNEISYEIHAYNYSLTYFKTFRHSEASSWSSLPITEMLHWVGKRGLGKTLIQFFDLDSQKFLRSDFLDSEIDDLRKLSDTRRKKIIDIIGIFSELFSDQKGLTQLLRESKNSRYLLLLALLEAHQLPEKERSRFIIDKSKEFLPMNNLFATVQFFNNIRNGYLAEVENLIYPYAFLTVLPMKGSEMESLDLRYENPVQDILNEMAKYMIGPDDYIEETVSAYKDIRNIKSEEFVAPISNLSKDAVKVVFMDTGLDYFNFPDLRVFLSDNSKGRVKSYDYADRQPSVFIPAISEHEHGSAVVSSFLTVFSTVNSNLLSEKKLDLGFWKLSTTSQILAGWPGYKHESWAVVKAPFIEAFLDVTKNLTPSQQPDIVSMSVVFTLYSVLNLIGEGHLMNQAPWLWVMASGNDGVELTVSKYDENGELLTPQPISPPGCMMDLPLENRPSDKILCVGALKRPEDSLSEERIARYSNFGDYVDVYTYESYVSICANGTSCATPAITGAAALLKGEFPQLTPEQLKYIIVEAATEKELFVENPSGSPEEEKRWVRVFDPLNDFEKARIKALETIGSPKEF